MIERKRYLELRRMNAVKPKSVEVICDGIRYHPMSLNIWFSSDGNTENSALLHDSKATSTVIARLQDVREIDNES